MVWGRGRDDTGVISQSETFSVCVYLCISRLVQSQTSRSQNGFLEGLTEKKKKKKKTLRKRRQEMSEKEEEVAGFCCSLCHR